jgi:toxin ParE1/3/4
VDSVAAADRWIERMHQAFERLAQFPLMGRERSELAPHLRSFPSGSYVIFYRRLDDGIEIIRVLHGARDIDAIFNP